MGQGPSTKSGSMRRTTSAMNNNTSFIESNPDPEISPQSQQGSQSLKSKSYMNYRKSTASLSKIFQKKRWRKRGSISASFNMNDSDIRVELINVNIATEEELMTLHGVNRALAQNIVNHRELIGGFKKIQDLALVSGMGASKLTQIRPEVCISRRNRYDFSLASSKTASVESITESTATGELQLNRPASNLSRALKLININQASIFDLMTVDGINQAMAARIIEFRDRKGPFRCVDDLRRAGIHRRVLAAIKIHLTTEEIESDKSSTVSNTPTRPPRRVYKGKSGMESVTSNTIQPISTSSQLEEELSAIYDLMCLKSKRPHPQKLFSYYYNNCPAYRVASWNMEDMTAEKISNPGVMEVIARTILENRFSILAVQEICDKTVLQKICKELNEPTLKLNREWTGYRGNWRFVLHPSMMHLNQKTYFLGVLYDSLRIDSVELPKSNEVGPIQNGSLWQYAVFHIQSYSASWILVNVLSIPLDSGHFMNGNGAFDHKDITERVKALAETTDGAMILGYFSPQQAQKGFHDMTDLEMVLPTVEEDNGSQPCTLWTTSGLKQYLTDDGGLIEDGLSHLAIPNGWGFGGKVSKHGPLWITLTGILESTDVSQEDCVTEEKDNSDDYVPAR